MNIGYLRVQGTPEDRTKSYCKQVAKIAAQTSVNRLYIDYGASGNDITRPQLNAMLNSVSNGDTIYISDYARLDRDEVRLLTILNALEDMGVTVIECK